MTEKMADELKEALAKRVNKKIYLKQVVDTSIIGGCIVKIGDKIIDGGIQKKLQELRSTMIQRL